MLNCLLQDGTHREKADMRVKPFKLERYFAQYEFQVEHDMAASDCEPLALAALLDMADNESTEMWESLRLGYTETRGSVELRKDISYLYQQIHPDHLLVCTPVEGIFMAMNSILEAGDHVICCYPDYQALHEVARAIGCEVDLWEADEQQGWRFDPKWLERHVRPDTRLIVVNWPHNPTGCVAALKDLERVVDIASRRSTYLFSDEMYRFLELEPGARLPAACDVYDRAVSLSGMSKAFGMAGARIGWLATRDPDLLARMQIFKDYTTICSSATSEVLSMMALRARDKIIKVNMERIKANLDLLDEFFECHDDVFYWDRPPAGTVAFPRLITKEGASEFCQRLVDEAGVLLLPASAFEYGESHVRVGFGRAGLCEALEALEGFLSGAKG